ncbi:MAG: hypothetical protein ACOCNX_00915 [Prevotella sp.]
MNTEELNALKDRAYKTAVAHDGYEEGKSDAYYLGLAMGVAGFAINADGIGRHADTKGFTDFMEAEPFFFRLAFDQCIARSVEDCIADIVVLLLEFAGIKGYQLQIAKEECKTSTAAVIGMFDKNGLSGTLFSMNGVLSDALDENITDAAISMIITIISGCFKKMTGSDKDLWWFVERRMGYIESAPKLNGKKY